MAPTALQILQLQSSMTKWLEEARMEPISLATTPAIDPRVLEGLTKLCGEGQSDLVLRLIEIFLSSSEERLSSLLGAVKNGDRRTIRLESHTLRGSSLHFGARVFSTIAENIEEASELGDLQAIAQEVQNLTSEFQKVSYQLQKHFQLPPRAPFNPNASSAKSGSSVVPFPLQAKASTNAAPGSASLDTRRRKILLVEDSRIDQELVTLALSSQYDVACVASANEALEALDKNPYDLVLVDVVLPDADGFDLCAKMREKHEMPIVFLTVKKSVADTVKGFQQGADDYISKPFDIQELLARIEARLKRARIGRDEETTYVQKGSLAVDLALQNAYLIEGQDKRPLHLTPIEFKLLSFLMRHEGKTLTRSELLASVWGNDVSVLGRTIDKHVCSLRQKLLAQSECVETVPGSGYRFKPNV